MIPWRQSVTDSKACLSISPFATLRLIDEIDKTLNELSTHSCRR